VQILLKKSEISFNTFKDCSLLAPAFTRLLKSVRMNFNVPLRRYRSGTLFSSAMKQERIRSFESSFMYFSAWGLLRIEFKRDRMQDTRLVEEGKEISSVKGYVKVSLWPW